MTTSREWHLTRRPHGEPVDEDFALVAAELPAPDPTAVVVRIARAAEQRGLPAAPQEEMGYL